MILAVFALSTIFFCMMISLDLGVAFIARSRLSKAVDAGVLAAARESGGDSERKKRAVEIALANYAGTSGADYKVSVSRRSPDATTVSMTGSASSRVFYSTLIGLNRLDVATTAEATRYPLDLSLALDLSQSLVRNGAFDDMQEAANRFIEYFDEDVDQLGLVTYSTVADDAMPVRKGFRSRAETIIDRLAAVSDTNIQEGLRISKTQLDTAAHRPKAAKVVVLFTDGQPTAFADKFQLERSDDGCRRDRLPKFYDGVLASYINGSSVRGLYESVEGRHVSGFRRDCRPLLLSNLTSRAGPVPMRLPNREPVNGPNVRRLAAQRAEEQANATRAAGYTIYAVALGNPNPILQGDEPNLELLGRIANARGIVNADQPRGALLFAPTPRELNQAFAELADKILTRLTK